jgi:hypothetical protein
VHRLPLAAGAPLTEFVPSAQERIAECVARLLGVPSAWRVSIAERPVVINTLVERRNVLLLEGHARHVIETFDRYAENRLRMVSYSHPGSYLRESDYVDRVVPLDEVRPHLTGAVRLLRERGVAVEASGACGFPSCVFQGDPTIAMFTEPELQVPETSPDRVYGEACGRCTAQPRCVGLRRLYVKHLGERGIVPYG